MHRELVVLARLDIAILRLELDADLELLGSVVVDSVDVLGVRVRVVAVGGGEERGGEEKEEAGEGGEAHDVGANGGDW